MSFEENNEEIKKKGKDQSNTENSSDTDNTATQDPSEYSEFISSEDDNTENFPAPPQTEQDVIESLKKELESVNAKLVETHNKMLRIAADADNTRKRLEKEKMDTRLYSIQEFARDLLPVVDAFEKALKLIEDNGTPSTPDAHTTAMVEGVKLVSKIFQDVTKKHGIERLPGKDAPFNPMYHNAIAKDVGENYKVQTVIEEFVPGYKIGDRVLRTALVKVGSPD